ncbi:MAG: DeoR/GlpR family DNA-binding transcription regulator [Pleomorphochaeta sp.]
MARNSIFQEERKREILKILKKTNRIDVLEMCEKFNISPSTARNDLKELESEDIIKRTHGGAILKHQPSTEIPSTENEKTMLNEKAAIAKKALQLINDGETIGISTGSTGYALAKELINKKNLTIITNDVKIACFLEQNTSFTIFIIGGVIRNQFHYIMDNVDLPKNISINKFFFSSNGFSIQHGATISDIMLSKNEKTLLNLSQKRILLCDHSKLGTTHFAQILPIDKIDEIIIDNGISKDCIEQFKKVDYQILIAD